MTDLELRAIGLLPLHDLPNKQGFSFIGVKFDGSEATCHVELDESGFHEVAGSANYGELLGWHYL